MAVCSVPNPLMSTTWPLGLPCLNARSTSMPFCWRVQVDVGDQQVERLPSRASAPRSTCCVVRISPVRALEQLRHEPARLAVVINDQNPGHRCLSAAWVDGQLDREGRAASRFAHRVMVPPCRAMTSCGDAEAEAGAASRRLGRDPGLEDARQQVCRDAGAGVADLDPHAVCGAAVARMVSVPPSGIASRLLVIEVQQRELELRRVRPDGRQIGRDLRA